MSFSLYELLLIIGITQGIITSTLLIFSGQNQPYQRLLGLAVLIFSLVNFRALINSMGWSQLSYFRYAPLGLELFLPPLIYLYMLLLTRDNKLFNLKTWLHFLPAMLVLCFDLLIYSMTLFEPNIQYKDQLAESFYYVAFNNFEDYFILLSTWIYTLIGWQKISAYLKWSLPFQSSQRDLLVLWLRQVLTWMVVLAVFLLVNQLLDFFSISDQSKWTRWQWFNVFLACTTYYLGFLGYRHKGSRLYDAKKYLDNRAKKFSKTGHEHLVISLRYLMKVEKIYLDSEINLKVLASELNVSSEDLSFVINQKLNTTFRDLINWYRVEAVKTQLTKEQDMSGSILDLALMMGFNSQASFYRAFNKFVGMTPKVFLESLKQ